MIRRPSPSGPNVRYTTRVPSGASDGNPLLFGPFVSSRKPVPSALDHRDLRAAIDAIRPAEEEIVEAVEERAETSRCRTRSRPPWPTTAARARFASLRGRWSSPSAFRHRPRTGDCPPASARSRPTHTAPRSDRTTAACRPVAARMRAVDSTSSARSWSRVDVSGPAYGTRRVGRPATRPRRGLSLAVPICRWRTRYLRACLS